MSLLTPERVPVKIYRWDDASAPLLNKTAGCMQNIFKSCLVTGYGTKDGAGWTSAFSATGVEVFRPKLSPHTDFFLRTSADTGKKLTAKIYLNMTNVNNGSLKITLGASFSYAEDLSSGKWVLIASPRGFAFFCEAASVYGSQALDRSGSYFMAGDISGDNTTGRSYFMQHSVSSSDSSGDPNGIFQTYRGRYAPAKLAIGAEPSIDITWQSLFLGYNTTLSNLHLFQVVGVLGSNLHALTAVFAPTTTVGLTNHSIITVTNGGETSRFMAVGTSSFSDEFVFIKLDEWVY